jgi:hypothetical protein
MDKGESKYNDGDIQVLPEYMPIESFLYTMKDNDQVTWIMDNIGVLRSVFKIKKLKPEKDNKLEFKNNTYSMNKEGDKWNLQSTLSVVGKNYKDDISIFHFNDGTAAMTVRNTFYHLHFEECPDDLFEEMKQKLSERKKKVFKESGEGDTGPVREVKNSKPWNKNLIPQTVTSKK